IKAADQLEESGTQVRVVSLPSFEIFEQECSTKPDYKKEVLPPELPIISVEAGITLGWERYADLSIGIDRFGASAPGDVVMDKLGINVETLITAVQTFISGGK
ncbi:MAG: transketolase, partial [Acidimicrobiales bacterium]|nr:transketolase [Acidimicrobiales bacterium]